MSISTILAAFDRSGKVSTDSRKVEAGSVFFALKGERFNGNLFAAKALDSGAALAVVDESEVVDPNDARYILVPDVLLALQRTAEAHRERFPFPVVGITGTNGKTTTKELLHAVLTSERTVRATLGNLNNHIGVPLTLLSMPLDLEVAIVEMGANKLGDIAELCAIAHPSHGLITNIGRAHLERFGDIEGVKATKGELFDSVRASKGLVFVNEGDRRVKDRAGDLTGTVRYGGDDSPYRIKALDPFRDRMEMRIQLGELGEFDFVTHLIGRHNAENVLAAVTLGAVLGISPASMQAAIAAYQPRMNRTQLIQQGDKTILLDAYNANPSSMEATLRSVAEQEQGRVALVLGDMFELGERSIQFHEDLLKLVGRTFPDGVIVVVGADMVQANENLQAGFHAFATTEAASARIAELTQDSEFVLLKGSRGMALEKLLPALGVS